MSTREICLSGRLGNLAKHWLNPCYEPTGLIYTAPKTYYSIFGFFCISYPKGASAEIGLGAHRIRVGLREILPS